MKKLFEQFLANLRQLKEQANKQLEGLKPLEQNEAAQQMRWFFDGCRYTAENLGRLSDDATRLFGDIEKEYAEAIKSGVDAMKLDEKVLKEIADLLTKDGKLVTKATAEGMVEAAKTGAETAIQEKAKAEKLASDKLKTRRGEVATSLVDALKAKHGDKAQSVAQEIADAIPDAEISADQYMATAGVRKTRLKEILELGVSSSGALQEVAKLPTDKPEAYDQHKARIQEIAESCGGKVRAPLSGGSGGSGGGGNEKTEKKNRPIIC